MYSLGPDGGGAIAGALLSPLKSLVAPAWGVLPGFAEDGLRPEPEIICVSSPAGFGGAGVGRAEGSEPLNNCVNPPAVDSVAGTVVGGVADG